MFAALCDDDKYITEEIKKLLLEYAKDNRITIDIDEFESGEELLNSEKNYDIIVLDYQLGSTNGLINYYKSITTSGYELRKIRHDYNDLSIGLKSLINSRKYDEVLPLLQKYDSEIISSFQILYNTGNDLTDAILSDKQKNADENIKITFEGSLSNVPADNLEICVLFNNMIDIAFENVKEFCGDGKQIIALKAETRAGFLFCCISFPIENEIKKAQNNVLYHSFAYKTLKNLAEKNGGKIETSLSDDRLAITTGWVINNFS